MDPRVKPAGDKKGRVKPAGDKRMAFYGQRNQEASLNLGDCFGYALAKATGEPLLFKGADFAKTDVPSAL
jgi:ribonuclease VapC